MIEVKVYQTTQGKWPFTSWYDGLKNHTDQLRIRKRVRQIALGNFGDSKSVGAGVYELRFFFGKGYRVYYAREQNAVILLLCGGDKSSQQKDIGKAKAYWKEYKERFYD